MMNDLFKKMTAAAAVALCYGIGSAEAPKDYYASCEDLGGKTLLVQLCSVVGNPSVTSYNGLWTTYLTSDIDENGKIWDMYSTKRWTPKSDHCGNYKNVGDCYNREHSFPKSWFSDKSPMYSDAFHIYPTDGKVNGQRSNYPYGECANGVTLESNGGVDAKGRLGACTFSGYTGTVFEPADEYKGDLARTYFYMAACYNDKIASWSSDMLAGNNYPAYATWAVNLLLKWNEQDPVSEKELKRQEAVYAVQGNRNPFIDHPEMADYIWGDKKNETWSSAAQNGSSGVESVTAPVSMNVTAGDGTIRVVTGEEWTPLTICGIDGVVWFDGKVAEEETFDVEPGIYVVRGADNVWRLLVK
jgi:endonuclease I